VAGAPSIWRKFRGGAARGDFRSMEHHNGDFPSVVRFVQQVTDADPFEFPAIGSVTQSDAARQRRSQSHGLELTKVELAPRVSFPAQVFNKRIDDRGQGGVVGDREYARSSDE